MYIFGAVVYIKIQGQFQNTTSYYMNVQSVPLDTEPGNEDIAMKFEQEYVRCVRNEEECVCSVCL